MSNQQLPNTGMAEGTRSEVQRSIAVIILLVQYCLRYTLQCDSTDE